MGTKQASKSKWLTQSVLNNEEERIFVKEVSGFGDLDSLFTEWTNTKKKQWENEHQQPKLINEEQDE